MYVGTLTAATFISTSEFGHSMKKVNINFDTT